MPNPNPKTDHLSKFSAPDTKGGLVHIGAKVEPEMKEWLKSLDGSTGYHIRQALRMYREYLEKQDTNEIGND